MEILRAVASLNAHRLGRRERASPEEDINLVSLQQALHAFVELRYHLRLAVEHFVVVKGDVRGDDAKRCALIAGMVQVLGRFEQGFGGDAALVETNAAEFLPLHYRYLKPKLRPANSGRVAPRPTANDHNVI